MKVRTNSVIAIVAALFWGSLTLAKFLGYVDYLSYADIFLLSLSPIPLYLIYFSIMVLRELLKRE